MIVSKVYAEFRIDESTTYQELKAKAYAIWKFVFEASRANQRAFICELNNQVDADYNFNVSEENAHLMLKKKVD